MKDEEGILIVAGIVAVGILGYLILQGSQGSSQGVAFGQANPQSVAALYGAQAADTTAQTQLTAAQSSDESGIAQSILSNLATFNNNLTALGTNAQNTQSAVQIANTNASSAEYSAAQAAYSQVQGYNAATAQTSLTAAASQAIAGIQGQTQQAVANTQSNAAVAVAQQGQIASSNVAASQAGAVAETAIQNASAASDASANNLFGSFINGALGLLSVKSTVPATPATAIAPSANPLESTLSSAAPSIGSAATIIG